MRPWRSNHRSAQSIRPIRPLILIVVTLLISGCGKVKSTNDTPPEVRAAKSATAAVTVFDLAGQPVDPFEAAGIKALVFLFVSTDCPISNRYAPEIRRMAEEFSKSGVRFRVVYPDADTSPDAIRQHLKEFQLPPEPLRDPKHNLVGLGQIQVTPEAAVFLPDRRLVYHGRIDDRYADLGRERPEAAQHDLRDALQAILLGKPAPTAYARAVGCYIADPK